MRLPITTIMAKYVLALKMFFAVTWLLKRQKLIHRIRKYMMRANSTSLVKYSPLTKDSRSLLYLKCLPLNVIIQ